MACLQDSRFSVTWRITVFDTERYTFIFSEIEALRLEPNCMKRRVLILHMLQWYMEGVEVGSVYS